MTFNTKREFGRVQKKSADFPETWYDWTSQRVKFEEVLVFKLAACETAWKNWASQNLTLKVLPFETNQHLLELMSCDSVDMWW